MLDKVLTEATRSLGYVAVWPAAVGMVIVGIPGAMTLAGAMTLFQRSTDDARRGRVFGALGAVEGIAILAGTLCAGFLGQALGIVPVLAVQGGGYVLAGFAMLVVLRTGRTGRTGPKATAARPAPGPEVADGTTRARPGVSLRNT